MNEKIIFEYNLSVWNYISKGVWLKSIKLHTLLNETYLEYEME